MGYEDLEENFEKGGFKVEKNPVGDLAYDEIEEKIFDALDDNFRTLFGIKKHAEFPLGLDIDSVIEGMQVEKKIHRIDTGTFSAYFRYNERPTKVFLVGDGTVGAEFDKNYVPRDDAAKAAELNGSRAGFNSPIAPGNHARRGKAPKVIDTDKLLEAAKTAKNINDCAAAVGVAHETLRKRLKADDNLRTRFDEARLQYGDKQTAARGDVSDRPITEGNGHGTGRSATNGNGQVPEVHSRKERTAYTTDMFREFGRKGMTIPAVAKALGLKTRAPIDRKLTEPDYRRAWDEGHREFSISVGGVAATNPKPAAEKAPRKSQQRRIKWIATEARMEDFGYKNFSIEKIIKKLKTTKTKFGYQFYKLEDSPLRAAFLKGVERREREEANETSSPNTSAIATDQPVAEAPPMNVRNCDHCLIGYDFKNNVHYASESGDFEADFCSEECRDEMTRPVVIAKEVKDGVITFVPASEAEEDFNMTISDDIDVREEAVSEKDFRSRKVRSNPPAGSLRGYGRPPLVPGPNGVPTVFPTAADNTQPINGRSSLLPADSAEAFGLEPGQAVAVTEKQLAEVREAVGLRSEPFVQAGRDLGILERTFNRLFGRSKINHPKKYNSHRSGVETIDIVEEMTFNIGSAVKNLWTVEESDDPIATLEKAKWFIEREIERKSRP